MAIGNVLMLKSVYYCNITVQAPSGSSYHQLNFCT